MKILILTSCLLSVASFPLMAQGPDLPGPEFAHPTATLPVDEIRIGADFRYLDDIHDSGPGYQDPAEEPTEHRLGSDERMSDAFLVARWGVAESVELFGRIGRRRYRPWGFTYTDGEFHYVRHIQAPGYDLLEITAGPKIEIHSERGVLPDVSLLSTMTFCVEGLSTMRNMFLGNTTRVLLRNTILEAGELRYSLGLNTRLEERWDPAILDNRMQARVFPSYTIAALLRLGNAVVLGPELLGEYTVPDRFEYDQGIRHWLGMGIRVSGAGLPEVMLAARTRSTFDKPTYQGQFTLSFPVESLAINESRR